MRGWLYSDTNYILLGMIIQKVTGHGPITEIRQRVLVPLGLHDTSFPLTSKQIPAPYAHGYYSPIDATNPLHEDIPEALSQRFEWPGYLNSPATGRFSVSGGDRI